MLEPHILNVSSTEALQQGMAKVPDHVSQAEKVLEWLICLVVTGTWLLWLSTYIHIYIYIFFFGGGISSSQLTLTPSFFRGVGQPPTSDSTSSDSTSSPVKSGGSDGQVPVLRQWMHQSAQPPKVGFDMEDGCYGSNLGIISMWFI